MTRYPYGVSGQKMFKKAKIVAFYVLSGTISSLCKYKYQQKGKDFRPATWAEKKCLEMISWHSTDDPVDDIFEFTVTRALR